MQKHNKYLIVTIWIATVAFIGAGAVGWGSSRYGSRATSYGKVGNVEISKYKFNSTYQNLYEKYRNKFGGQFDDAKAKELGLYRQTFNILASQAKLLNMAKEYGVIVSDKELAKYIETIQGFQNKGVFKDSIYKAFLKSRSIKTKDFESSLRDDLVVQKLIGIIESKATPFEVNTVASALSISDKIKYKVIKPSDIKVNLSEKEIKKYWQESKDNYMTPKSYKLDIVWTDTSGIKATEKELKDFYDKNSFNYVSADGKQLDFDHAKALALEDYRVKKSKKAALLNYVAFKKGIKKADETITIDEGDKKFTPTIWAKINSSKIGDFIKPKILNTKYASIRIAKVIQPRVNSFDKAKKTVVKVLSIQKRKEQMSSMANKMVKSKDSTGYVESDWLKINTSKALTPLNKQESLQFLQKLFSSSEKNGIIVVSDNVVVYKITDQKMGKVDSNLSKVVKREANTIKKDIFESNLFKVLDSKYKTEKYVKGI